MSYTFLYQGFKIWMPMFKFISFIAALHLWELLIHLMTSGNGMIALVHAGFSIGSYPLFYIPGMDFLQNVGWIGMLFALFEDGLYTELDFIQWVALPSVLVALIGPVTASIVGCCAMTYFKTGLNEAICASVCLAAVCTGRVRVHWGHQTWTSCKENGISREQVGQILAASSTLNTFIVLMVYSMLRGFSGGRDEGWAEWQVGDIIQPGLLSCAFMALGLGLRYFLGVMDRNKALTHTMGKSSKPKNLVLNSSFNFPIVYGMLILAFGLAFFAEFIRVSAGLGAFVAGMAFSNVSGARKMWDRHTRNLSYWLQRIFIACTCGFVMKSEFWRRDEDALGGMFVMFLVILAKLFGGMVASLPFLVGPDTPVLMLQSLQIGAAHIIQGHIGLYILTSFRAVGLLGAISYHQALWGVLWSSFWGPLIFELVSVIERAVVTKPRAAHQKTDTLGLRVARDLEKEAYEMEQLHDEMLHVGVHNGDYSAPTPAEDMRRTVLRYQRVSAPAPSPYKDVSTSLPVYGGNGFGNGRIEADISTYDYNAYTNGTNAYTNGPDMPVAFSNAYPHNLGRIEADISTTYDYTHYNQKYDSYPSPPVYYGETTQA